MRGRRAVREGFLQEAVSEHPLEEDTRGRVAWRLAFRSGVYGGEWQGHWLGDGCGNPASASAAAGVGLGRCSVPWLLGQSQHLRLRATPPVMREAHTEADGTVSTTLGASLSPQFGCAGHGESLCGPRWDGALSPRLTQLLGIVTFVALGGRGREGCSSRQSAGSSHPLPLPRGPWWLWAAALPSSTAQAYPGHPTSPSGGGRPSFGSISPLGPGLTSAAPCLLTLPGLPGQSVSSLRLSFSATSLGKRRTGTRAGLSPLPPTSPGQ